MIYLLIFTVPLSVSTLDFPFDDVHEATKYVFAEWETPIKEVGDNEFKTAFLKIDLKLLDDYITDDQPDDNPGWTNARFRINITLSKIESRKTEIEILIYFERFGTPSAMLLIPPVWTEVSSNGKMEQEIKTAVEEFLHREMGRE